MTFLFTDIEGSTPLWDRSPRLMALALARHDTLVIETIAEGNGFIFSSGGDGYAAAFSSASTSVATAISLQQRLLRETWPTDVMIKVRMGLHTGIAEERDSNYFGATVSRAARIADAGSGGQIILSAATAELVADDGLSLADQGLYRLTGFSRPDRLYRVIIPDVPDVSRPLRRKQDDLGNLPHHRAPLIGRNSECRTLDGLIERGTLVSVTGVGGVGKTRLALSAARAAAHRFADGAWLVELAAVVAAADLPAAVASQLGLQPETDIDAVAIATILARQARLVVLDNCEHLLDAVTQLTDAIGRHCPDVTVLATTREALGVDGERVVAVAPLGVEGDGEMSDASRLFCERASGVLGSFNPPAADLAVVDDICRRLDGLPLAIELAAARLPTMTVGELDSRLGDRFPLLTRRRSAVDRHLSLHTTIDWSYDLLSDLEQHVFERFSVFAGDFDLAAAVAVVGDVTDSRHAEDIIGSLVGKSLVVAIRRATGTRYQLLESLRQYGDERLKVRGEAVDVRQRHLRYFLDWSSRADAGVRSTSEITWHQAFVVDWHNVRNAVAWACATCDDQTVAMLLRQVGWWATIRVQMEVADWADAALRLARPDDQPVDPIVRSLAGFFAAMRGDVDAGRAWFEEAAIDAERLGRPDPQVWSITIWVAPNPDEMLAAARELQRRATMIGDRFWTLMGLLQECTVYMNRAGSRTATVERMASDTARVREVLELVQEYGMPNFIGHASMTLGGILRRTDPDEALVHLERALEILVPLDADVSAGMARLQLAALHTEMQRPLDAFSVLLPTFERHLRSGAARWLLSAAAYCIRPLLDTDNAELATLVLGAVLGALDAHPQTRRALVHVDQAKLREDLGARLGQVAMEQLLADGRRLALEDVARQIVNAIGELTPSAP